MGEIVEKNLPCLDVINCGSSDARQVYEDGGSFCFSCKKFFNKDQTEKGDMSVTTPSPTPSPSPSMTPSTPRPRLSVEEILTYPIVGFKDRHIKTTIAQFYGVRSSYGSDGVVDAHFYPYNKDQNWQVRKLPKDFWWATGMSEELFGQDKFNGAGKRVVITEGAIDAMSVAQAYYDKYEKVYPVVAMTSSSSGKQLLANRDWLRSFKEVVLMFDMDDAGEAATKEACKIIGIDKVKIAQLPENDPNDVLIKHGSQELLRCVWDAAPYVPAGIISKEALWEALEEYNNIPSIPYAPCMAGVNEKLKGHRFGEITLFISGTGSGKSTLLREDMLWIKEYTEDKIGVISLEESPAETARKLAGMELELNPAKDEIPLDQLKVGFDKVFGDDRFIVLDHQGSINDDSIIDQLEYMCLMGCKYIYIDHITILVSEGVADLKGNEAQDKIMNDLLRLVKRHDVWIGLVSHLRKTAQGGKSFEEGKLPSIDDIRGSGSIKQVSFDIIAFARNLTAKDEKARNTIKMRVLKSRYTGLTGTVPGARYEYDTGRLHPLDEPFEDPDDEDFEPVSI